ncbi:Hypothetical protein PENO1_045020 [Penicillium occitanis (nom. inval.)]|nr:hypothetical protein PENOC_070200 [Penicillium occitanis (nom. inval.)]PCH01037.1 Hypothetical protein PENO1_045020 [Penicillium occitanis (nom. inval.)]
MDAQYPFASREDIWRVFEEVKDLYSTQLEHGERIARLERRREDDARLKSVWGPISQFPSTMSGPLTEPSYTPTVDAFKGFDQGHHHSIITNMTLDNEEEPRRGASRANSVRFDESAINGYYGQVNRSTSELPIRTGSAVCSGSYTSSLGYSLIEKLGYVDQILVEEGLRYIKLPLYLPEASIHQTSSRAGSPTPQLPAVTVRFVVRDLSPDDKSIHIIVGSDVLRSHNADILFSQDKIIMVDDDRNKVSIPLVRPENDAVFKSLNTASDASRESYAKPQQPHGAEMQETVNGRDHGVIERPVSRPQETGSIAPTKVEEPDRGRDSRPTTRDGGQSETDSQAARESSAPVDPEAYPGISTKTEPAGPWGSWRRTDGSAIGMAKSNRGRTMKVLRPSKSLSSRVPSTTSSHAHAASNVETVSSPAAAPYQEGESNPATQTPGPDLIHPTPSRTASFKSGDGSWSAAGKTRASNPIGGASAFGWLNSS